MGWLLKERRTKTEKDERKPPAGGRATAGGSKLEAALVLEREEREEERFRKVVLLGCSIQLDKFNPRFGTLVITKKYCTSETV